MSIAIILIIIFWNFTIFQHRPDLPQVKQNLIFSITNLVCENRRFFERLKTQKLCDFCLPFQGQRPSPQSPLQNSKIETKVVSFYSISLLCSKYFLRDCASKQNFDHNWTQFTPNFNVLTFSYLQSFFYVFVKNIKQFICPKVLIEWFCVKTIVHVWFKCKFDFTKLSTLLVGRFLTELTFFRKT